MVSAIALVNALMTGNEMKFVMNPSLRKAIIKLIIALVKHRKTA